MRITVLCSWIAILSIIVVLPETSLAQNLGDLSGSVAYLQENGGPVYGKFGTGFFVTAEKQYLITAAHVAKFISQKSVFTIRDPGDVPVTVPFRELFPNEVQLPWHFRPQADVAVLSPTWRIRGFYD